MDSTLNQQDPALSTVYDGLVAQRRSGGAASITLVPDLARTLPRPAGGGTVYTFTLRRGIRYSNGVLVRASDFRRGIMRHSASAIIPLTSKESSAVKRATRSRGGATCRPG